jgi:hypothetical protein
MYEPAASCRDIARAPATNWIPQCVTLAEYSYAVRHGMKVKLVTSYRVSHLKRYGVTVRSNVTSVDPPLGARLFVVCTGAVTRDLARLRPSRIAECLKFARHTPHTNVRNSRPGFSRNP